MDNTWAVVNNETGLIVNAVAWDGVSDWAPPDGHSVHQAWPVHIGWMWVDGEQVDPNPALPDETMEIIE